jgi:hypothetical protein
MWITRRSLHPAAAITTAISPRIDKCEVIEVSDMNMQVFRDDLERYRKGIGIIYSYGGPIPYFSVSTGVCDGQVQTDLRKRLSGLGNL